MWYLSFDKMKAADNRLYDCIKNTIIRQENQNLYKLLFISDFQNRSEINLMLLKYFLQEQNKRGIFISFDRPHQYILKLLEYNQIDKKNLMFIDAVSLISGEITPGTGRNVKFMKGPYQISLFKNLVARCFSSKKDSKQIVYLNEIDFIMIDDISALSIYNELNVVEDFINNLYTFVENMKTIVVALVMDANYNKEVYNIMSKHSDIEILINPSKNIVKIVKCQADNLNTTPFTIISKPNPCPLAKAKSKGVIV